MTFWMAFGWHFDDTDGTLDYMDNFFNEIDDILDDIFVKSNGRRIWWMRMDQELKKCIVFDL